MKKIKISFADLTHMGQIVSANTFPLGSMFIASYARKILKDKVDIELFRYPADFKNYLDKNVPDIACFTVFTWNRHLAHEYARHIKATWPHVITIFGGVNFPTDPEEQAAFLTHHHAIDFFIDGEGEQAFVDLYHDLEAHNFDIKKYKQNKTLSSNVRYLVDQQLVRGPLIPRIMDLDIIPSPFEGGFSDKFIDTTLSPMIQRTRGCPYSCTFCHEGDVRFSKVARFSIDRIEWELKYLAPRVKVPELFFVDLNYGMFKEDVDTAHSVAEVIAKYDWPKYLVVDTAKNNKDRIIEISKILHGALPPGASVQTTDEEVLKIIKRKNLPLDHMVEIAKTRETDGASSRSEIILCLPGDSKRAHFKSVFDVVSSGMSLLKSHQYMLLEGTESASKSSRAKFNYVTKFRIQPRCFGAYEFADKTFVSAETEEICVGNSTMTYQDYQDCRDLTLTVETFNNDGLFYELSQFLQYKGVSLADFIMGMHNHVTRNQDSAIHKYYEEYRKEEQENFWQSREEAEGHIHTENNLQKYIQGEFGNNELYKYRAIMVFNHLKELHQIAYSVARNLLAKCEKLDDKSDFYLSELEKFSLERKTNFLDSSYIGRTKYHFDFDTLSKLNYSLEKDPYDYYKPDGIALEVFHSESQKKLINGLINQYGTSLVGVARILGRSKSIDIHRLVRPTVEAMATVTA